MSTVHCDAFMYKVKVAQISEFRRSFSANRQQISSDDCKKTAVFSLSSEFQPLAEVCRVLYVLFTLLQLNESEEKVTQSADVNSALSVENSRLSANVMRLDEELIQSKEKETQLAQEISQLNESFQSQVC